MVSIVLQRAGVFQPHTRTFSRLQPRDPLTAEQRALITRALRLFSAQSGPPAGVKPETSPPTPLRHKLMSYNAHNYYVTQKGRAIKSAKSAESEQALGQAILLENPDVVALQEVGSPALLARFNQLCLKGLYPHIVRIPLQKDALQQVAFLSKQDIHPVEVRSHYREMASLKDYQGKRDFLEATFETPSGYRFTVYNAHFKSMWGGEKRTFPKRLAEAENAAKVVRERLSANENAAVFVVGDLNTKTHSLWGRPVLKALTHLDRQAPETPTLTEVTLRENQAVTPTYNGTQQEEDRKLDYMFVSKAVLKNVVKAYVAGDFQARPWSEASDHLPVVTVFDEPPAFARKTPLAEPALLTARWKPLPANRMDRLWPADRKRKLDMLA